MFNQIKACVLLALLCAGSVEPKDATLDKIEKYLRLGMYPEATAAIETAVKQNEFDPNLRSLYGEILERQQRYTDALEQFELWSRLDTQSWQALQHIAITAEMIRSAGMMPGTENKAGIEAWEKAYQSWGALAKFKSTSPDTLNSELLDARNNAREMIKQYEKPSGLWQSTDSEQRHHYFIIVEKSSGEYNYHMKGEQKIDLGSPNPLPKNEVTDLKETMRGSCELASSGDSTGSVCTTLVGHAEGQVYEGCICDIDYTATLLYGYTTLRLGGKIRKVYGPNTYSCRALRDWGPVDRIFENLMRVQ